VDGRNDSAKALVCHGRCVNNSTISYAQGARNVWVGIETILRAV